VGTEITGEGSRVATATSPPVDSGWDPASCKDLGVVVGAASNGLYTDEHLVAFALNDLRNKAAELGLADGSGFSACDCGAPP